MRLLPDVPLKVDGVRSTSDRFRDEIETILNAIIPLHVPEDRLVVFSASQITEDFEWGTLLEQLVGPLATDEPIPQPVTLFPTLWD